MLAHNGVLNMWTEVKGIFSSFRKLHTDNRGTSMVTVIISFALLLLCIVSYFRVQKVVENMMMSSTDMLRNNSGLVKAYYLEETENTVASKEETLNFTGEYGNFSLDVTLMKAQKEGLNGSIYYFEKE